MKLFVFVLALMLANPALAGKVLYGDLRENLIDTGWIPAEKTPENTCFEYKTGACGVYPEAFECSGFGIALCLMVWVKGDSRMEITTAGEFGRVVEDIRPDGDGSYHRQAEGVR